jgi:large subunit ribosomal protein L17
MRHMNAGRRLSRKASHRNALLKNMVTSVLTHERIQTTDAKAKEVRGLVDNMITLGKRGDLHARRQAAVVVNDPVTLRKLFSTLAERYRSRHGGYTRVVKVGFRPGDGADISVVELVDAFIEQTATATPAATPAK